MSLVGYFECLQVRVDHDPDSVLDPIEKVYEFIVK